MNKEKILNSKEFFALRKQFGDFVRKRRCQLKLSQEELGFRCGLHRTYIGSIERAEANLTLDNIVILAITLRCEISDLVPCLESIRKSLDI